MGKTNCAPQRRHPTVHPSCLIPREHGALYCIALEHGALYCIGRPPPDTRKQRLTSAYCHAHTHTHTRSHTHTHTHHTRTHTRNRLHCNPLHLLHCSRDAALYCTILNCFWEASAHNTAFTVAGARYCITVCCDGGPRLQSSNLAISCSVLDTAMFRPSCTCGAGDRQRGRLEVAAAAAPAVPGLALTLAVQMPLLPRMTLAGMMPAPHQDFLSAHAY